MEPGVKYFAVRKLETGFGPNDFYQQEVEGDEGLLAAPAASLVASKLALLLPKMTTRERRPPQASMTMVTWTGPKPLLYFALYFRAYSSVSANVCGRDSPSGRLEPRV